MNDMKEVHNHSGDEAVQDQDTNGFSVVESWQRVPRWWQKTEGGLGSLLYRGTNLIQEREAFIVYSLLNTKSPRITLGKRDQHSDNGSITPAP